MSVGIKPPLPTVLLVNRIKSLSRKVLQEHKDMFGNNFVANKKALESVSIISSKGLKNEIAGYITNLIKREQIAEDERLEQERIQAQQELKAEEDRIREEKEQLEQDRMLKQAAEEALAKAGEQTAIASDEADTAEPAAEPEVAPADAAAPTAEPEVAPADAAAPTAEPEVAPADAAAPTAEPEVAPADAAADGGKESRAD